MKRRERRSLVRTRLQFESFRRHVRRNPSAGVAITYQGDGFSAFAWCDFRDLRAVTSTPPKGSEGAPNDALDTETIENRLAFAVDEITGGLERIRSVLTRLP